MCSNVGQELRGDTSRVPGEELGAGEGAANPTEDGGEARGGRRGGGEGLACRVRGRSQWGR